MLLKDVEKLSEMERFAYWIVERHNIFLRRQQGLPKPWTDDEVLQNYFFTNPFRENDKVTQWFRTNVRDPLKNHEDVLFATIAFRWFNYIPTGVALCNYRPRNGRAQYHHGLLEDWELQPAISILEQCSQVGQVFTGAFNISNSGSTKPKINRVCEDYIQPVWEDVENLVSAADTWESLEEAHQFITKYPGLGGSGFMAYEVVSDLRYTIWLRGASDILTWANPGPGAKRGYNRLRDYPLEARLQKAEYNDGANQVRQDLINLLKKQGTYSKLPPIDARTIEHSLCEFDKYERARMKDGHMKRTYPGKG